MKAVPTDHIRHEVAVRLDQQHQAEPIVRAFLLQNADQVRLTAIPSGGELECTLQHFRPDLLKKEQSRQRFPNLLQPGEPVTHYFFRLSPQLKQAFNKEGMFWSIKDGLLAGLEDPVFYKQALKTHGWPILLGNIISHEEMIDLYLTRDELALLRKHPSFAIW